MDAEPFRRFGAVTVRFGQRAGDHGALQPGDRGVEIALEPVRRSGVPLGRREEAEIASLDHGRADERRRPLHRVLQLTHVAGPGMREQPRGGLRRQALRRAAARNERQEVLRQRDDVGQPVA